MKMKTHRSKKGMRMFRHVKQSMRKTIWIFSACLAVFTLSLMIVFDMYEPDKTFADGSKHNQPIVQSNSNAAGLTYENISGNGGHQTQMMITHQHDATMDDATKATANVKTADQNKQETGNDAPKITSDNLIDFRAVPGNQRVEFAWIASSEVSHGTFTIERSVDGEHFEDIIIKPDMEDGASGTVYSATDEHPVYETAYYRLKHVQPGGHTIYSSAKKINQQADATDITELNIVSIGPNPFNEKLSVTFTQQLAFEVDFEIINAFGNAVFIDVINAHEGTNKYEFTDQKGLPKGTYFMTLLYNHKKQVRKIVKN